MLRSKKYSAFIDSIRKSLVNGQYEFNNRPFNKDSLCAFGANWYGSMEEFKSELDEMMLTLNHDRLAIYVKEIYEEITHLGVLFKDLVENYENKYVCNDGKAALDITKYNELYSLEAYRRMDAYMIAIEGTADIIRKDAAKYLALDLTPIRQLTSDNYTIDGKFIVDDLDRNPTPTNFADLFLNKNQVKACIDALRLIEPSVISDTDTWIGGERNQSVIVAWIDVLEQRGKIKKLKSRVELSKLLNAFFNGLKLETNTASIFSKQTNKRNDYQADFLELIKKD